MSAEIERLETATRNLAAIQTSTRHMQRALEVLSAAEIEARQEVTEAREAVQQAAEKGTK